MDRSFVGCPVYVQHVDEVPAKLEDVKKEADGWVVKSFYNEADGKHWCQFVIHSERGLNAIARGWKLSNAYMPQQYGTSGRWNGVDYDKEVVNAEYLHLAIVPDPRYQESIVLTPQEFRDYNEKQSKQLALVANSRESTTMKVLSFFKRTKIENAAEFSDAIVVLEKSKKEMSVADVISKYDDVLSNEVDDVSKRVKVGDEEMTVNEICEKYMNMKAELDGYKNADDEKKKKDEEEAKKNEEDKKKKDEEANKNSLEEKKKADAIKNAEDDKNKKAIANEDETVQTMDTQVSLGKSRYGSGKK